jgi:hypothetical protein
MNEERIHGDHVKYKTVWTIHRYPDDRLYAAGQATSVQDAETGLFLPARSIIEGNILLNAGIGAVWDLVVGTAGPAAFNLTNARIGVGSSNAQAIATQVGLQATSPAPAFQSMNTGYPQRSNQTQQWQAVFSAGAANFAWNEFCVDNGTISLNRVVSAQGTKASGQTWTVTVQITLS